MKKKIKDIIEFLIQLPRQIYDEREPCPYREHNPERCGLVGHTLGMNKSRCTLYDYKHICLHAALERAGKI